MKRLIVLFLVLFMMPIVVLAKECRTDGVSLKSVEVSEINGMAEEIEPASIVSDSLNLNLKLSEVGDYIEYNIVVENNTNDDYELSSNKIGKKLDYVKYELITTGDSSIVKPGEKKTVQFRVSYNREVPDSSFQDGKYSDSKELVISMVGGSDDKNPGTGYRSIVVIMLVLLLCAILSVLALQNVKISKSALILLVILVPVTVVALCEYQVKVVSKVEVEKNYHYVYTANKYPVKCQLNMPIPSNVQVYTKASEVGANPLLRHKIVDGKVVETSVGLFHSVLNDYIYLVGGGATYNASNNTYIGDSPFYLRNKAELVSMYGNTCSESRKNGVLVYECDWIDVGADGDIWAQLDCHNGCAITPDGSSYCGAIRC